MKKTISIFLACSLVLLLCACGTGEIYIHDAPDSATPAPAVTAEPEIAVIEPDPDVIAVLGAPVVLGVSNKTESYKAPDGSDRVILTYGYDAAHVYLENNASAADRINQYLALQDEIYYSGSDSVEGVNVYLEQATDNYTYVVGSGLNNSVEFSCVRSVSVERGDSRILSLRYRTNSYTGGTHGLYVDRCYVFDVSNGMLLTLDDLSEDRAALEQLLLDQMLRTVNDDVRYQPLLAYIEQFAGADPESALKALIREGSWTLSNKGLAVFSDIYEIGSYADGIVRFTVPYEELTGVLREEWMPVERPADGSLSIVSLDELASGSLHLLDRISVSDYDQEFCVYAQGTVYDISVDTVTYIDDDTGFYPTETHWYCSYLSDNGIQIKTSIPDGMPDLLIRTADAAGQTHSFLVTQSGEDGSVLLLEEARVVAVG